MHIALACYTSLYLNSFLRFFLFADENNRNSDRHSHYEDAGDGNERIPPHRHDERHAGDTDDECARLVRVELYIPHSAILFPRT